MAKAKPEVKTTEPYAAIKNLLDDAAKALPERADLRRVTTIAGLRLISAECERLAADLEDRSREFRFSSAENEQPY